MAMVVRPKVVIAVALSVVLVFVILSSLYHQGTISIPKVKEVAQVIGWDDIELGHEEVAPGSTQWSDKVEEEEPAVEELEGERIEQLGRIPESDVGPSGTGGNELGTGVGQLEDFEKKVSPSPVTLPWFTEVSTSPEAHSPTPTTTPSSEILSSEDIPPFDNTSVRIYIGVVTAWWQFAPRTLLREAYTHFPKTNPSDIIDIRFILGKPAPHDTMFSPLLQWENDTFGDIHMIDMQENMNDGKSYEYFASMAQIYGKGKREQRRWDYVMKVDDDTFLHLGNLIEKLRGIRREKLWFGRGWKPEHYMFGPGYLLSWDLVTWLADNRANFKQFMTHMPEDRCISEMIKWGGLANSTWLEMDEYEYNDYPDSGATWAMPLNREKGILVHRLKDLKWLAKTIGCFTGSGACET